MSINEFGFCRRLDELLDNSEVKIDKAYGLRGTSEHSREEATMEIYSLPISVVIAMWVIQRIKKPGAATINVVQHLTGQIESMNDVLRIENPLRDKGWFENIMRNIVQKYRGSLIKERSDLIDVGVSEIGFIPKFVLSKKESNNETKDQ